MRAFVIVLQKKYCTIENFFVAFLSVSLLLCRCVFYFLINEHRNSKIISFLGQLLKIKLAIYSFIMTMNLQRSHSYKLDYMILELEILLHSVINVILAALTFHQFLQRIGL